MIFGVSGFVDQMLTGLLGYWVTSWFSLVDITIFLHSSENLCCIRTV